MPIINVEIMKTTEKENYRKQQKNNKQRQKGAKGTSAIVKGWDLNAFVVHLS